MFQFFNKHLFMMEIYITRLLQIWSFPRPFRRFEIKNFHRRPTIVADNISLLVAPLLPPPPPPHTHTHTPTPLFLPEFFSFLRAWNNIEKSKCNAMIEKKTRESLISLTIKGWKISTQFTSPLSYILCYLWRSTIFFYKLNPLFKLYLWIELQ